MDKDTKLDIEAAMAIGCLLGVLATIAAIAIAV